MTIAVKDANNDTQTVNTIGELMALIGEVQASPTSNTLLDRVKATNTALATLHTDLATTLAGYVDGLETLIGTSNTNLGTLHTDLATTLAGLLTSLNGYVDQLEGYVDGLETLVTSTNTKLDTLHTDLTAATPAGTNLIGKVGAQAYWIDATPTLDTSAYASGDTLFGATSLANAFRVNDGTGKLVSVSITDKDKQLQAMDLLFFDANVTMGTLNAACAISDADAAKCMGVVRVAVGDWADLGGSAVATVSAGFGVHSVSGAQNMYVAAVARGAPTHTASGLVVRVHVDAD